MAGASDSTCSTGSRSTSRTVGATGAGAPGPISPQPAERASTRSHGVGRSMREAPKIGAIHHTKAGREPGKVDWLRHVHVAPPSPPGRPAPGSIGRESWGRSPAACQLRRGRPAPVGPSGAGSRGCRADGGPRGPRPVGRRTHGNPGGGGRRFGLRAGHQRAGGAARPGGALPGGRRSPAGGRGQTRPGGAGAGRRAPGAVRRGAGALPGRGVHPAARPAAVDEPRPGGGGVPVPGVPGGRAGRRAGG
jgi:hypothetical protein